jgi:hypothetical protein
MTAKILLLQSHKATSVFFMKKHLVIIVFLICFQAITFAQFEDDFSDGDFTQNPEWIGETSLFSVENEELRLTAPPEAGQAYLATASQAIEHAIWEFNLRMTFQPSGSNLARIYLVSNLPNLKGSLQGYFVKVGDTPREISLYRQDGAVVTEIIDGVDGRVSSNPVNVKIRVTRDAVGNWELLSDTLGGNNFFLEGQTFDNTYLQTQYFGVRCIYTATRSDRFYFDNFKVSGLAFTDTVPPSVLNLDVIAANQLLIRFNEPIAQTVAENTDNYWVNQGVGNPTEAVLNDIDPSMITLTFAQAFPANTECTISISNIEDLAGNVMPTSERSFLRFVEVAPAFKEVVINEIMANPGNSVGIPEQKFIELYNPSPHAFNLDGWKISDRTTQGTINAHILPPGGYVILCSNAQVQTFQNFGNTVGVNSFPSPNITSDDLSLRDNQGNLIDYVYYTNQWYQDSQRASGGYTLELTDPYHPCMDKLNWRASQSPMGGTPGKENSTYSSFQDDEPPYLERVLAITSDSLVAIFNEPLGMLAVSSAIFTLSDNLDASNIAPIFPEYSSIGIKLSSPIDSGKVYTLSVEGIADCSGNMIENRNKAIFVLPLQADVGDLIINEVLFAPRTGSREFVEIYNRSDKIISLEQWHLANRNNEVVANHRLITGDRILLFPEDYIILTQDSSNIRFEYPKSQSMQFLQMSSLPSYNNTSGSVFLIDNLNRISDSLDYHSNMHFPMLRDVRGVSLERLDFNRPSNDEGNWHSAAKSEGFATPGYKNSQFMPTAIPDDAVELSPEIFSPDNDGVDDLLNIIYKFDKPGYVGNIRIFDTRGRTTRYLVKNELLATSGVYTWNGMDDNNERAKIGSYILLFEIFDTEGNTHTFKKIGVVAGR